MQTKFTISPMSQDFTLTPGETVSGAVSIVNSSDATGDFQYKVVVVPYNISGDGYTINTTEVLEHSQIANWISVEEESGEVGPNSAKKINFTIKVPEGIGGGGQSAAIVVSPDLETENAGGAEIVNTFALSSIIYANVTGEAHHGGEILENQVPRFLGFGTAEITSGFSNTGNMFETALIRLTVKNKLTGEVISEGETESSEVIVPDTTKYVTRRLDNLPLVGVVEVSHDIRYNGSTSNVTQDLVIFPVWLMAVIVIGIAVVVAAVTLIVRRLIRKRRTKMV